MLFRSGSAEHRNLLDKMRRRLVEELRPRDCGLTRGDELVVQDRPILSPWYRNRLKEMPESDKEIFRYVCKFDIDG